MGTPLLYTGNFTDIKFLVFFAHEKSEIKFPMKIDDITAN